MTDDELDNEVFLDDNDDDDDEEEDSTSTDSEDKVDDGTVASST
jgi:hypothetical protein